MVTYFHKVVSKNSNHTVYTWAQAILRAKHKQCTRIPVIHRPWDWTKYWIIKYSRLWDNTHNTACLAWSCINIQLPNNKVCSYASISTIIPVLEFPTADWCNTMGHGSFMSLAMHKLPSIHLHYLAPGLNVLDAVRKWPGNFWKESSSEKTDGCRCMIMCLLTACWIWSSFLLETDLCDPASPLLARLCIGRL